VTGQRWPLPRSRCHCAGQPNPEATGSSRTASRSCTAGAAAKGAALAGLRSRGRKGSGGPTCRLRDGWRPGYLAEELEVGLLTIIAWRHGQRPPTLEQLERMRLDKRRPRRTDPITDERQGPFPFYSVSAISIFPVARNFRLISRER
jgi:hypothetical protein